MCVGAILCRAPRQLNTRLASALYSASFRYFLCQNAALFLLIKCNMCAFQGASVLLLRCITICYALVFVLRYVTLGSSTALYPNRFRVCWSVEKVEHKTHECLCSAFFKSCYNTALLVTGNSDILVLFLGVLVFSGHLFLLHPCSCLCSGWHYWF